MADDNVIILSNCCLTLAICMIYLYANSRLLIEKGCALRCDQNIVRAVFCDVTWSSAVHPYQNGLFFISYGNGITIGFSFFHYQYTPLVFFLTPVCVYADI